MTICFNTPVVFYIPLLKFDRKSFNLFIEVFQKFKLNVYPFYPIRFNINELAGVYFPVKNTLSKILILIGLFSLLIFLESFTNIR